MTRSIRIIALLACLVAFFAAGFAMMHAQQIVTSDDVLITTEPRLPGPFEDVTVSLQSFVFDINTTHIAWIVDGDEFASGIGVREIDLRTKNVGDPTLIEVRVKWNQVDTLVRRVRIDPAYVDVLWESANGYAPPFYRGKVLPTSESQLRFVALPSGIIANDQYVYTWKHNGQVDQKQSGYQKHSFETYNEFFDKRFAVDVEVTGRRTPFRAQTATIVPLFEPEILFEAQSLASDYPLAPAPGGFVLGGQFNRLIAHPLHFTGGTTQQHLDYVWEIDGEPFVPVDSFSDKKNEIPLVTPTTGSGFSNIDLRVVNSNEILQEATASTQVRF